MTPSTPNSTLSPMTQKYLELLAARNTLAAKEAGLRRIVAFLNRTIRPIRRAINLHYEAINELETDRHALERTLKAMEGNLKVLTPTPTPRSKRLPLRKSSTKRPRGFTKYSRENLLALIADKSAMKAALAKDPALKAALIKLLQEA